MTEADNFDLAELENIAHIRDNLESFELYDWLNLDPDSRSISAFAQNVCNKSQLSHMHNRNPVFLRHLESPSITVGHSGLDPKK